MQPIIHFANEFSVLIRTGDVLFRKFDTPILNSRVRLQGLPHLCQTRLFELSFELIEPP
ncbi:hypothetical protein MIZ03_0340 [Rhodoferax lithotrophicus]|uniref:Uncharacterized protein n=1 Tax=Rhodoferax lithotrophicus TaxID=2798804 RepID=A0ABN6D0P7_9BURK|nr:hypothetical protein MIZ03_0340 [Rhodoferax sp. MIZ03]